MNFHWDKPTLKAKKVPPGVQRVFGLHTINLVGPRVFVLGKRDGVAKDETPLAVFDLQKMEWFWWSIAGRMLLDTWYHYSFLASDCIYIIGVPYREHVRCNESLELEVFRLDLTLMEWNAVSSGSLKPEARRYPTGQFVERRKQFVCFPGYAGRYNASAYFQEFWVFDVETMQWHKPTVNGRFPQAHGQASCVVDTKIYFFGGKFVGQPRHVLYVLDCSRPVLQCTSLRECHSAMGRVFASLSYVNGRLLLFGGYDERQEGRKELFVFESSSFEPYSVSDKSREGTDRYTCSGSVQKMYAHCAFVRGHDLWIIGGFYNKSSPIVLRGS